jgi:hypothetical protein
MLRVVLWLLAFWFFVGCEEKMTPRITVSSTLKKPIECMRLNSLDVDRELLDALGELYTFDNQCDLVLSISYKKDIVCNSAYNVQSKSLGRFPRSYLKMELRRGMKVAYTYYVDLYNNVDEDDIEEGFLRLKQDLMEVKSIEN